jgi:hypothetical protein
MRVLGTIEEVALDAIQPHPKNTRRHPPEQIELLKNSLREFGQYRPIVVQADTNYILVGNGVYAAARELGFKTVRITRVECDEREALAVLMADNRLAELSWWDYDAMATVPELQEVLTLPVFDDAFVRMIEIEIDTILEQQANAALADTFLPIDTVPRAPSGERRSSSLIIRTVLVALTQEDDERARRFHAYLREVDTEYAENTEDEYDGRLFNRLLAYAELPAGAD